MTSRGWCFTIIYETDDGRQANDPLFTELPPEARFVIWQKERGGNTHRLHYQGYIKFNNPLRAPQCKEKLGANWAHVEKQRATDAQAANYCLKDDTRVDGPWQLGEDCTQGKRLDLEACASMLKEGKTLSEVADEHPTEYIKFSRGLSNYQNVITVSKRRLELEVIVLWGKTRTGKSRWCWDNYPDLFRVNIRDKQPVWWDGYQGESAILMDDFEGQINRTEFLNYLDIYPMQGPVKGGFVKLNYITVMITSNTDPETWYPWCQPDQKAAYMRRLTKIYHILSSEDLPPNRIDRFLE